MARAVVVTQAIPKTGVKPTLTAPTVDGDVVDFGKNQLWVVNAGGAPVNVTIQTPNAVEGLAVEERVIAVAVGTVPTVIPLDLNAYKRPVGGVDAGKVYVDYTSLVSMTRGVISL